MFLQLMSIALQSVSPAHLAQADRMNTEFVTCLFAMARQARSRSESPELFEADLKTSCRQEEQALRTIMVRVLADRGQGKAARAKVDDVVNRSRQAVVDAYKRVSSDNNLQ